MRIWQKEQLIQLTIFVFSNLLKVTSGKIIKEFKFDGEKSTEFNIYFSPNLSKILEICSAEDLPGDYQIIFEGTNYQSIKLKILNQYLPGTENMFESVC